MTAPASPARFAADPILPHDPPGAEVLHEREYRVRAYRVDDDHGLGILLRGAVRDQKPAGLLVDDDPDPLTFHHMQVELRVAFPSMEVVGAEVLFEAHPQDVCPAIAPHYRSLIGLSVARGFTHEVRQRFGGPRGCTHTTALLLAMAPVAVQCILTMQTVDERHGGRRASRIDDLTPDQRRRMRLPMLNTCHVWQEHGDHAQRVLSGAPIELPLPLRRRLEALGVDPPPGDPPG